MPPSYSHMGLLLSEVNYVLVHWFHNFCLLIVTQSLDSAIEFVNKIVPAIAEITVMLIASFQMALAFPISLTGNDS